MAAEQQDLARLPGVLRPLQALGADARLLTLYQIHSAKAVTVTEPWEIGESPQADGLATALPGIALGLLTADCAPVLLADAEAGVIGAAHAGWKGALYGVVESTVAAMEKLGNEGTKHTDGLLDDGLLQPIYGQPDASVPTQYVSGAVAVAAAGKAEGTYVGHPTGWLGGSEKPRSRQR